MVAAITPESPALLPLSEAEWLYDATEGIDSTFHAFGTRKNAAGEREDMKIDYIFLSCAMRERVSAVAPWQDEHAGVYLSDHYPICLEFN